MQYKCQECNDTGGRDKIGAYFDCNACDTAAIRRDLNDFVKSLTQRSTYPTHPEDVALAIHQRALAMAPKQEAIKVEDERAAFDTWYDATPSRQAYAWDAWKHRASVAAPAAANGALTDERAAFEAWAKDHLGQGYSLEIEEHTYANPVTRWAFVAFKAGRAILAAAGPDATPIDAKPLVDIATAVMSQHGLIDHLSEMKTQEFCDDLRAALSGAKGN